MIEPITVSNIHYVRKSDANFDATKLFGTINSSAADFHSRYLPSLCKEKLESAKIGKTIEIDLKRKASCCRVNVGRENLIVVCFWDICLLMTYDAVAGSVHKELDLSGMLKQPLSAAFVSDDVIAVACKDGLVAVDIETATVAQRINSDHVTDVFYDENKRSVYALNVSNSSVDSFVKDATGWSLVRRHDLPKLSHPASSMVVTSSVVVCCNNDNSLLQCDLETTSTQQALFDKDVTSDKRKLSLCAVDFNKCFVLVDSAGKQLVLQTPRDGPRSTVCLEGVQGNQDIVFQDRYSFWILDSVSFKNGQYRMVKFII